MNINFAENKDIKQIKELAYQIWPTAYSEILTNEQIKYMLDLFYSEEALKNQMNTGQQFVLIQEDSVNLGFAAFEHNCKESGKTKLHKIYVLPNLQGKGVGKMLLDFVETEAQKAQANAVFLNVNKYNKAKQFYQKLGYQITKEEVIDIGNNYIMDDYVMEKSV